MKRALWAVPVLALCVSVWHARASYTYYFSENLRYPDWSHWTQLTTSTGYISPHSYGGYGGASFVVYDPDQGWFGVGRMMYTGSSVTPGEVKLTVRADPNLPCYSCGTFAIDLSVSSDIPLYYQGPYQGTGYRAVLGLGGPTDQSYVWVQKIINGVVYTLAYTAAGTAHDGMTLRAVRHSNGQILVYTDDVRRIQITDTAYTSGLVGLELLPTQPAGTEGAVVSQIAFGSLDTTPPNAISSGNIGVSAFSNHVDLQWPAGADDTNGSGVYNYEIWRNGGFLASTTGLSFSDTTVGPNVAYTYTLKVVDFHGNSASTNVNVTTPRVQTSGPFPSVTPEGRRVGVRATGAYWGASGENIDVMSGNLNFTLPLLSAKARNGWSVGFNLNYNSQNWRNDSGGNWNYGRDVGYGWGWRLMAGSITPVFSDPYTVSYYLFTDSTGSEYRLDQNSGNVWSSKESVYVYYDANASRLYFRDGNFWYFGCTSAATEADSGVLYPTLMQDSNGNQIIVHYKTAPGATWTDSSARISSIEDVRNTTAYAFAYNNDTPPHLTNIGSYVNSGESYTFTYLTGQSLYSPFNSQSFGTTTMMRRVTVNSIYTYHEFTYNGSGEMTKAQLPYLGYLAYDYTTANYSSSRSYREVIRRYLSKDGSTQTQYTFSHEPSPGPDVHQYTILDDPGGVGEKYWSFATSGLAMGLPTQYQGRQLPGPVTKTQNDFTWAQEAAGNSYIATSLATVDPGQSYQAQKKVTQTVDIHGNVTQVNRYAYGNLTTPVRTDNYTYLGGSNYSSRYIFNRLATGPNNLSIAYDDFYHGPFDWPNVDTSAVYEWDQGMKTVQYRGNPTSISTLAGTLTNTIDVTGHTILSSMNGASSSATINSTTNYAAPSQVTTGGLSSTMSYSFLSLTNETDPNGAQVSIGYDAISRPSSTTSPFGATTTNTYYDGTPPTVTTTVNGRWTKVTKDGLGRPIKTETGDGSGTVSVAETEYDSCGCSPLGKMKRTALPHAPAATPVWTTYTYDGIGRTLTTSTVGTDTQTTTTYVYEGNKVTVSDATGKWKKYITDALGQLTQVSEPNPAGGADYVTNYVYDSLGHLISVSMPRPTGTQTRTFNYGNPPGAQLLSATNPENGTVAYTYNSDKTLATKTDAKGQQVQYTYDSNHRVSLIKRGTLDPNNGNQFAEDTCQRETYSYDTNPYDGSFSQYSLGRLTAVQYKGGSQILGFCPTTFTEMYSYSQAGGTVKKRLRITRMVDYYNSQNVDLDSAYAYDSEGRITSTQYPSSWAVYSGGNVGYWAPGPQLTNTYDSMGRLQKLTDVPSQTDIISNTTYNPAGQLLTTTGGVSGAPSETRTYNSLGQLTQLSICPNYSGYCPASINTQYAYSATQNNGKIASETDVLSGEQVTYTYDSLNRLASATSSVNPGWGQSYAYDGFGNLTTQTVTKGTAPSLSVSYDPATNRRTGESADANGNICVSGQWCSYDVENRLAGVATSYPQSPYVAYTYAPGNKRVWRGVWNGSTQTIDEITFWGANGQRLGTWALSMYYGQFVATTTGTNYYFGGKLIKNAGGFVTPDRLGSNGKFFPYGQERPSATTDGKEKFATYFRDSETGLDYAENRYHQPGMGRFMTADRYTGSAKPSTPNTWNRYSYVEGDPISMIDRHGASDEYPDYCNIYPDDPNCYPFRCPNGICDGGDGGNGQRGGGGQYNSGGWDAERALLIGGKDYVAELFKYGFAGTQCQKDLDALTRTIKDANGNSPDISQVGIAVANMLITDGSNNADFTVCQTLVAGADGYDFYCNKNPGLTIGKLFANDTQHQLGAWAALPGSDAEGRVFFNPDFASNEPWTESFAASLLMHEALHNIGGNDKALLAALGQDPNGPSDNINKMLEGDCFYAGPWYHPPR